MASNKVFLQTYGDSLTEGFPYSPMKSWPMLLSKELGTLIIISGENGRTLLEMEREKERHLGGFCPSYVTIMGGTNDFYMGMDSEFVFMNMVNLAEWVKEHGSQPIICLPPPSLDRRIEEKLSQYREDLREWILKKGGLILDFDFLFRGVEGEIQENLLADECHPTEEGYRKMADQARVFFTPLFKTWQEEKQETLSKA